MTSRASWPWWAGAALAAAAAIVVVATRRTESPPARLDRAAAPVQATTPDPVPAPAGEAPAAALPARDGEPADAERSAGFECGSGPCDPPGYAEAPPADADPAPPLTRPLPADMDAWALDPQVDPDWRRRTDGRPETLGNLPPDPDEFDVTPADEAEESGYPSPSDGSS